MNRSQVSCSGGSRSRRSNIAAVGKTVGTYRSGLTNKQGAWLMPGSLNCRGMYYFCASAIALLISSSVSLNIVLTSACVNTIFLNWERTIE
ncbi:hypothetical protein PAECIP111802_01148 [Paenibacillus allorhizosphaerae]|uniref:Uncharacterized protein n=1 Tax=Paenibacillus allorhizosphaerae TaxID=2849866 RepID=A0ABM8VCV3_9BACL|nr:hypothetical protein PAECIP111802_01148 [Paenibacillus allorhizosphaerae]